MICRAIYMEHILQDEGHLIISHALSYSLLGGINAAHGHSLLRS